MALTTVNDSSSHNDFYSAFDTGDYSAVNKSLTQSPEQTTNQTDQQKPSKANESSEVKTNPRSCITCRRRKVKCDKREPCSNCTKASIQCVFPPPGRAPRKPRRPQDAELLKRLRRLESVVDSLGAPVEDDDNHSPQHAEEAQTKIDFSPSSTSRNDSLEHSLGQLIIKDGRSQYVSNDFWTTLGEEITDIKNSLFQQSSDDEDEPTLGSSMNDFGHLSHHQGFLFGYSSLVYDMRRLCPSPSQIFMIWEVYKENCDPILKIFHVTTTRNLIMRASASFASLSRAEETLFFAICFASIVSMNEEQCQSYLGEDKDKLMNKFRFACEQSFARAGFLNSSNFMILQALVLFLLAVRYIDNSRSIWILVGLAMHQAQAQGLHRDGTNFNLNPFETEMRRRLWWHISLLDARASEDHGADPTFFNHFFDTQFPTNINDDEISPDMTEPPLSREGASDLTFTLIRFELGNIARRLRVMAGSESPADKKRTVEEIEELIDATHAHMEQKYFRHCDSSDAFLHVASTVGKMILAKMWLSVHHPRLTESSSTVNSPSSSSATDSNLRSRVYLTSVSVIEFGATLQSQAATAKWAWLFKSYMQWHAMVYVLNEICHMDPRTKEVERGWKAVLAGYDQRMIEQSKGHRGVLWKPLRALYIKAERRVKEGRNEVAKQNGSMYMNDGNVTVDQNISMSMGNASRSQQRQFAMNMKSNPIAITNTSCSTNTELLGKMNTNGATSYAFDADMPNTTATTDNDLFNTSLLGDRDHDNNDLLRAGDYVLGTDLTSNMFTNFPISNTNDLWSGDTQQAMNNMNTNTIYSPDSWVDGPDPHVPADFEYGQLTKNQDPDEISYGVGIGTENNDLDMSMLNLPSDWVSGMQTW